MINRRACTHYRTLFYGAFLFVMGCVVISASPSFAQNQPAPSPATISMAQHAKSIANSCLQEWKNQGCYGAVSDSNQELIKDYIAKLKTAGHPQHAEKVRQECAASTAIRRFVKESGRNLSANAVSEAFTVCVNQITEASEAIHVKPDPTYYQLLLIPTLCLREDPRCGSMAASLRPFLDDDKKPKARR